MESSVLRFQSSSHSLQALSTSPVLTSMTKKLNFSFYFILI